MISWPGKVMKLFLLVFFLVLMSKIFYRLEIYKILMEKVMEINRITYVQTL